MATLSASSRKKRAKLGYATRTYGPDSAEVDTARRDFAAERLADYIKKTLDAAPQLTNEQRVRLAELLRPVRKAVVADRLAELDSGALS